MSEFDPTEIPEDDILDIDLSNQQERKQFVDGQIYTFIVENVEQKVAKSSGNPQLMWTLRFPDVNNRTVKHYTGLTDTSIWKTEEIVVALGLAKKGEKVSIAKRQCVGRRGSAKMKLEDYEGKSFGKVDKVMPHKDGWEVKDDMPF